ncbi:MAG: hypothetical protein H0V79_05370 [Actinobacteria bacterium]|nr:hypothetical protein [Actinomycetota bacterium]
MTDESYKLHEIKFPSEREEALMAPAKNDKLVGKTGREVAQAVLDGQATPEEAGAVLLARLVKKLL